MKLHTNIYVYITGTHIDEKVSKAYLIVLLFFFSIETKTKYIILHRQTDTTPNNILKHVTFIHSKGDYRLLENFVFMFSAFVSLVFLNFFILKTSSNTHTHKNTEKERSLLYEFNTGSKCLCFKFDFDTCCRPYKINEAI